jgi:hypothetical protein
MVSPCCLVCSLADGHRDHSGGGAPPTPPPATNSTDAAVCRLSILTDTRSKAQMRGSRELLTACTDSKRWRVVGGVELRWGPWRRLGVDFGWCVVPEARFVPVVVGPDKRRHCWFALGEGVGQGFDDRAGVQLVDVAESADPDDNQVITHTGGRFPPLRGPAP